MAAASLSSPLPAAAAATGSPRLASAEEEGRMVVSSPPSAPLAATAAASSPHPAYPEMIKQAMTDLGRDRAAQFFVFIHSFYRVVLSANHLRHVATMPFAPSRLITFFCRVTVFETRQRLCRVSDKWLPAKICLPERYTPSALRRVQFSAKALPRVLGPLPSVCGTRRTRRF